MITLPSLIRGDKGHSAGVAKERLQIILALERSDHSKTGPDYLAELQHELVSVVSKYVQVNASDIKVHLQRQDTLEVLEVKVELPDQSKRR